MKRTVIGLLILVLLTAGMMTTFASVENEDIKVSINGHILTFDAIPEVREGRTMVPMRTIFEALGMTVEWQASSQTVTAEKENLEIVLRLGSSSAWVNGELVTVDVPAYISEGRTLLPLRFVAETTGAQVSWDSSKRMVAIVSDQTGPIISSLSYKIVDTGVSTYYTDRSVVDAITTDEAFYGQDANYTGYQPDYTDNGHGTVTDNVTGLMWQQTMASKMTYETAVDYANESQLAGYDDWRLPTIKELFSLILFTGESGGEVAGVLYIDTDYFNQPIGDTSIGEREIDAQTWSSTQYVGTTMHDDPTVFGVNFIDGRIKGYPLVMPQTHSDNKGYFRLVRGNEAYGENVFVDNGDGTISDLATGLMWQLKDDGNTRDWQTALDYAEHLELAGYDDWRLPNIKELQSLVDYTQSPQTTGTAAIDSLFVLTAISDPEGKSNYGFYWSSTTHQDGMNIASSASYVAFGEAQGQMNGQLLDVHGAGAVRSDPKSGAQSAYPSYFGPQGDVRYVYNYVLAVRDME